MNWPDQVYVLQEPQEIEEYDPFFWKKKSPEQKAARKKKRKAFWGKVGQGFQQMGGAAGVLQTASNVVSLVKGPQTAAAPSDYQISVGATGQPTTPPEKKGIPMVVWAVGGLLVLAAAGFLYKKYQKKPGTPPPATT